MASNDSDAVFERVKDEYMSAILEEIRSQARKKAGESELQPGHVYRAFEEHFAGLPRPRGSLSAFVQDNLFLLSALLLTVTFGLFGLYHGDEEEVSSFLDIAKIFAGAVVGGAAGGSVAAAVRRREDSAGE